MSGIAPDFEALYAADPDPWRVADRPYEQHKLGVVAAALSRPSYGTAWDLACGTGHLTRMLAGRSTRVVAADLATGAVEATAAFCADLENVEVRQSQLPAAPSDAAAPDLVVLSEVFYYLDDQARRGTLAMIETTAATEVLAVHWSGAPGDAFLSGPAAQQEIVVRLASSGWCHRTRHVEVLSAGVDGAPGFTLDVLTREVTA